MSVIAEAMIAAFDSTTRITWATKGLDTALAKFTYRDLLVTITFAQVSQEAWQVGFEIVPDVGSVLEGVHHSIRIFSGVFQAVREFLEVRQPARLVFASKQEALGHLYETYMQRRTPNLPSSASHGGHPDRPADRVRARKKYAFCMAGLTALRGFQCAVQPKLVSNRPPEASLL